MSLLLSRYSRADSWQRKLHRALAAAGAAALLLGRPAPAVGHEVPTDVTVLAFLKPEGGQLHFLARVPLLAMRDVDLPTRGPGYLDLAKAEPALRHAAGLWIADPIEILEGDERLPAPRIVALRVSLPSDRSFSSYERALEHLAGPPLPEATDLPWNQAMLDVHLAYAIGSAQSRFAIRPDLARLGLRVVTALRFLPPGGAERAFELRGDPGLVRLDPRWHQAALRFVALGFAHILDGTDHLLFLVCLVIPFRQLRGLILVVTAFTAAHSITLLASAFDLAPQAAWFPPLVETLIAASIVYMALENILAPHLRQRWMIAFGFGLVHGFGFSFALRETLQFAGSHVVTSLLAFNLGVEIGQVAVLVVLVPALGLLFRVVREREATIILSAFVAHTGWHWVVERWEGLRQFPLGPPAWNAAALASGARWLMLAVAAASVAWLLFGVFWRPAGAAPRTESTGD